MKVYKRHRKSPGALSGDRSRDPSPSRMDSLVESQIAMLEIVNLQVATSNIPLDTPNPPVDLPVDFSNLTAGSPKLIPLDTLSLPVNPPKDLPEDISTPPDKSSG